MATKKGGLGRGLGALFEDLNLEPKAVSIEVPEDGAKTAQAEGGPAKKGGAKKRAEKTAKAPAAAAQAAPRKGGKSGPNAAESVVFIGISDIKPNAKQPRKAFDEEALQELADSIREYGVIQPVLVRPAAKGYELVAGERRWRAARKAGLKTIPVIVRELDERQNAFYALIENMQREDLNAIEEADGMQSLMDEYGLTQEQAAKAVGKSRSYVANALRLRKLPEAVRAMISGGQLSAGAAKAIAGLKDEALQLEAAQLAVREGWSVRRIESYTGTKAKRPARRRRGSAKRDRAIAELEEKLTEKLGTKVRLLGTEHFGKLQLEYYSREELEGILELLL